MTAGVPGTGIGGLFYLAAALLLPLRGIWRRLRRVPVAWPKIVGNTGIAAGILLGIWATGWILGLLVVPSAKSIAGAAVATGLKSVHARNFIRWAALAAGYITLAVVLLAVQAARFSIRKDKT
ncbi:MAG: hypothetical protein NTZ26_00980 [Candidatus Aminicenantes bacterium]|nr:hypothetical protein [Candidatus Aminicenantes bacterium]